MVWALKTGIWILLSPLINAYIRGDTQDQTSTRQNTLFDDADDIQKQLDNEARDRLKYGMSKTIWVLHLPTQYPDLYKSTFRRSLHMKGRGMSKSGRKLKPLAARITDWDYANQKKWSAQNPECGGRSQSPIDLPTRGLIKTRAGRRLVFRNYDAMPKSLTLRDDGKRLVMYGNWGPGQRPLLSGGAAYSRRYLFHSLTLHWPSEHFVGGIQFPMESQVIHISAEYGSITEAIEASKTDPLAILGVVNLYMIGNHTQNCLKELLKASENAGIGDTSLERRPIGAFSPPFKEYVAYQGSLTSPPCTESVLWMVRARSLVVTKAISTLANSLTAPNGDLRRSFIRQTQSRNDRKIFFFN